LPLRFNTFFCLFSNCTPLVRFFHSLWIRHQSQKNLHRVDILYC
jgi:hypothetical protein